MKYHNALFLLHILVLIGCKNDSNKVISPQELPLKTIAEDSIARIKKDSINKIESDRQAYLSRPWRLGTFNDEYGEPTKDKFVKMSVDGSFSNSATSNAYLYVEVLIEKNAAGIFLHEYEQTSPSQKFIGIARIKMKNSAGKELEIVTSSAWNQKGGILLNNFTMVKGAESYEFSNFRNFIKKSVGEIKVIIYDKYSSSYRFNINTTGFVDEYSLL